MARQRLAVRPARRDELRRFAAMERAGDVAPHVHALSTAEHRRAFDGDGVHYLTVRLGRLVAGFVIVAVDAADAAGAELRRIVVRPRGRGLGRRAMAATERWCRDTLGVQRIWLDVYESNARGRRLYESLGYRGFGEQTTPRGRLLLMEKCVRDRSHAAAPASDAGAGDDCLSCSSRTRAAATPGHALDPLTAAEVQTAAAALRARGEPGPRTWIETVALAEPDFTALDAGCDESRTRTLYVCAWDPDARRLWRGEYCPAERAWRRFEAVPGAFPRITGDEFAELGERIARHPRFAAALAKRGIRDPSLVLVEPWGAGHFDEPVERQGRRLVHTHCWVREQQGDNAYARPVAGLHALVDADSGEVLRLDDRPRAPLAPERGNFRPGTAGPLREDLRPLAVTQPEGPGFRVDGYRVRWQKWSFRVGFGVREGLVLWDLRYRDGERERPVLRRASLAEMVVPYFSPEEGDFRRNAFDCGEYGIGQYADSLRLGCDCLGSIHYFDVTVHDWHGRPRTIEQAVCLHEEDAGILARHSDPWHERADVRRARRLVVSFITTVGNYVYAVYWYLYQDATIACEVKLTGIVFASGLAEGERPRFGTQVAPGVQSHLHQHVFVFRMDTCVDGPRNTVTEVDFEALPGGPGNPHGNAVTWRERVIASERDAGRRISLERARYWRVSNAEARNRFGEPVAWKLLPGLNALPFAPPDSPIGRRARCTYNHLWVTRYDRDQLYPAGWFPNQQPGPDGIPRWIEADRPLVQQPLVLWYVMNVHHLPRPEDWPLQPVVRADFHLQPEGFFDRSPALDLPR